MYKSAICAVLLIAMPLGAMKQEQTAGDDRELNSSTALLPPSSSCDSLSSGASEGLEEQFFNGTDEEFFNPNGIGDLKKLIDYSCDNPAPYERELLKHYITVSSERGCKLLKELKDTRVKIYNLQRAVEAASEIKAIWQEYYRNEQAKNLKLQNTVVVLSATSISMSLAGLAAYLYMKKS